MKLIDKDALVAEIEKRISEYENCGIDNAAINAKIIALQSLLIYINSIEVKEVDLELNSFDATVCKICNTYLKEMDKDAIVKALEPYKDGDKVKVIIKAHKGEEV